MRTAPTNAAIPVPPQPASGAPRVWKIQLPTTRPLGRQGVMMLTNKTKVLLVLTQDLLDRARVLAGKATTALKLPVSLQIVLRALIEVGLKRDNHPTLLANVEGQAKAVRHQRSVAGRAGLRENRPERRR